jgi:hypothetical protein
MFSKSGFKILGLSCMLFIILLLGKAPVVCAFPSADLPPVPCPGGVTRVTGPAFVGTMTIVYQDSGVNINLGKVTLTGRCKNETIENEDFGFTRSYDNQANFANTTGGDMEGFKLTQELANRVNCSPQFAVPIVNTVTRFSNNGTTMVVGVVILWEVCVIR